MSFVLKIKAIPNAVKFEISGLNNCNELKVKLKNAPEKNRANIELIKEFEKRFNAEVRILKGLKSRRKELLIGLSEKEFLEKMQKELL